MKFFKILFFTVASCMMLTACPGSDIIDDIDDDTPGNTTGGENTPGGGENTPGGGENTPGGGEDNPGGGENTPGGIDDLHNTTSNNPAYSPARK